MTTLKPIHDPALFDAVIAMADDTLILGHRLSEWSGKAPTLEEDIALSNLALDLIGQARVFYAYAGEIEGRGRDEDQLAYHRDEPEFRNVLLVELPNGDFAQTMLRHLFVSAFLHPCYQALATSTDPRLAEVAAKAVKEMAYHVRHSADWVVRLGDGTPESRGRCLDALEVLWGFTGELFETPASQQALVDKGIMPDRAGLMATWQATVTRVMTAATLPSPTTRAIQSGGRSGRHSEHLGHLLAVMQVLARRHPDATW